MYFKCIMSIKATGKVDVREVAYLVLHLIVHGGIILARVST